MPDIWAVVVVVRGRDGAPRTARASLPAHVRKDHVVQQLLDAEKALGYADS